MSTIYAAPGATFETALEGATTGLVGTVGVAIEDGQGNVVTARTTAGIVESPDGSGVYQATLTAPATRGQYVVIWDTGVISPDTTAIDELVVSFSSPVDDAPYFTVEEFRARYTKLTEAEYPDEKVDEYRQLAEQAFEDAAGVAFVPRTTTTQLVLQNPTSAFVLSPRLRSVTGMTMGGTEFTESDLEALLVDPAGVVAGASSWTGGATSVTFEHGYDEPPLRVKQAVMLLCKTWLVKGPVDERATQIGTEDGPINLSTPGMFGATFGIPEVDSTLRHYEIRSYVV